VSRRIPWTAKLLVTCAACPLPFQMMALRLMLRSSRNLNSKQSEGGGYFARRRFVVFVKLAWKRLGYSIQPHREPLLWAVERKETCGEIRTKFRPRMLAGSSKL
jgi:hypothetical protein